MLDNVVGFLIFSIFPADVFPVFSLKKLADSSDDMCGHTWIFKKLNKLISRYLR